MNPKLCALPLAIAALLPLLAASPAVAQDDVTELQADFGTEALDPTSLTSDQSINVPTSWWMANNHTPDQLSALISDRGARLTQLQVETMSGGLPRFAARLVKNSGSYAASGGWWWYYGLTPADITSRLNANTARLIDVEPYDSGNGVIRYAVVMVSNTGSAARGWSYLIGANSAQISTQTSAGMRLIDIDSYSEGGVKKYTAVFVSNTGADKKSWQYFYNQTVSSLTAKVSSFQGRVVALDRQSDGTYNFVQVRNTGSDTSAWWHGYDFTSSTAVLNYANQLAARPVALQSYLNSSGQRRYSAAFIDNANAATRRMRGLYGQTFLDASGNPTRGIFSAYLRQVGASPSINLNGTRKVETASALKALHLLHAMKEVEAGRTTMGSAFTYYNYPDGSGMDQSDRCPNPFYEIAPNKMTDWNFERGLDEMMGNSDNRTTRGVVLRYGMPAINATGTAAGLTGTTLKHDIGCAYLDLANERYDPAARRNNTTAADLATIYDGVWRQTILSNTNSARNEFLESANPGTGASSSLQAIINQEATAAGKSGVAASFGAQVKTYSKGGSYGTCLGDGSDGCGQMVIVRSSAGLMRLPIKSGGLLSWITYAYGHLISDVPVPCWENFDTDAVECPTDTNYTNAFNTVKPELFREVIRSALATW